MLGPEWNSAVVLICGFTKPKPCSPVPSAHHNPEEDKGVLVKLTSPKSAPVCPSPSVHVAVNCRTVEPEDPTGGAGTCQVVSMVSVIGLVTGAAGKVPEVVHQVLPDSVLMVTLHVAASVVPRSGAGSEMLNLSPRASPVWMLAVDCGDSQSTVGGAFSVAHPV